LLVAISSRPTSMMHRCHIHQVADALDASPSASGWYSRDGCERATQPNMSDDAHPTGKSGQDGGRVVPPGYRIPKHGGGMLKPFPPGSSGRPPNTSTRYSETLRIAREASPEAMRVLIQRLRDPDGRIAVVAANSIMERAWGKVREMKPEEQTKAQIDLSKLSNAELALLMKLVEDGRLTALPDGPNEAPPVIDGAVSSDR
jgi:hypothetical protein